ncbi:primosomal protein N', partial [Clostridium saudiense]|nr:primosomal protein N' [Clostridium saudiense]
VTGSGKTEIYMRLVQNALIKNESSIVLVPEIALTPQMIERFKGRFGKDVALFHSRLSDGERFDEWYRVKEGKARVIVGARSALFLPAKNLGLIIIDEEHENTYKSEQNPKYQAKEVAEYIANKKGAKLVLGSATPTIESYYRAISGEIDLVEITKRVDGKPMPKMELVDMREELKIGNRSLFSRK